jgi:hypothetical protein
VSEDKLPIIKIISEEDEMHVKLELEMEEETKDILVRWGKEDATDDDYASIAIREGLLNVIKDREKEEAKEDE